MVGFNLRIFSNLNHLMMMVEKEEKWMFVHSFPLMFVVVCDITAVNM